MHCRRGVGDILIVPALARGRVRTRISGVRSRLSIGLQADSRQGRFTADPFEKPIVRRANDLVAIAAVLPQDGSVDDAFRIAE